MIRLCAPVWLKTKPAHRSQSPASFQNWSECRSVWSALQGYRDMKTSKSMAAMLSVLVLALCNSAATAQSYPDRPIKLVLPYAPGGIVDTGGRLLARALEARLKQPIVADNRPGAGGVLGTGIVAQSPPDGYTIFFHRSRHRHQSNSSKKCAV